MLKLGENCMYRILARQTGSSKNLLLGEAFQPSFGKDKAMSWNFLSQKMQESFTYYLPCIF
jgi:hypothetical protein